MKDTDIKLKLNERQKVTMLLKRALDPSGLDTRSRKSLIQEALSILSVKNSQEDTEVKTSEGVLMNLSTDNSAGNSK